MAEEYDSRFPSRLGAAIRLREAEWAPARRRAETKGEAMSENGGDWVVETKPIMSTVIPTTEARLAREERLRPIQRAYRETSS